jgi:hypothetical protein
MSDTYDGCYQVCPAPPVEAENAQDRRGWIGYSKGSDVDDVLFAVAMGDLAVEEPTHGRKADMGMGADIHALAGNKLPRSEMVEEDERTHHLALAVRQGAADLEGADVAAARHDYQLNLLDRMGVAGNAIFGREPCHPAKLVIAPVNCQS